MKLVILSGRSGSGKSIALNALEDSGYFCIDNLPLGLTNDVIAKYLSQNETIAISVDARNPIDMQNFTDEMSKIKNVYPEAKILFTDADENILLKRFSETRRRHPLTRLGLSLRDAINQENKLLAPIRAMADLVINTSELTPHELREQVRARITENLETNMDLQFTSFGFKHGAPKDTDFIFDVRCLPNPHWVPELRALTGKDEPIVRYLDKSNLVMEYFWQLKVFLDTWIPEFEQQDRSYFTCAIGCTGGKHRSVYMVEKLAQHFKQRYPNVRITHRQFDKLG